ncbi:MAG: hypothetical protein R3C56_18515 [Pirellulaceae bacterium]
MWLGFQKFEFAHTTLGAFLHFHRQAEAIQLELKKSIEYAVRSPLSSERWRYAAGRRRRDTACAAGGELLRKGC